jgi:hypothetical protein
MKLVFGGSRRKKSKITKVSERIKRPRIQTKKENKIKEDYGNSFLSSSSSFGFSFSMNISASSQFRPSTTTTTHECVVVVVTVVRFRITTCRLLIVWPPVTRNRRLLLPSAFNAQKCQSPFRIEKLVLTQPVRHERRAPTSDRVVFVVVFVVGLGYLLIECVRRELAAGMIMMTLVFGWAFLYCCCCWAM